MKFDVKDFLWCVVALVLFWLGWSLKGCGGKEDFDGKVGEGKVTENKIDTVWIKQSVLVAKYEKVDGYDALVDSLAKNKKLIDSLYKNRVMVMNEKSTEITKIIPVLDSLGSKITSVLDLKMGDKVLRLPAVINVSDSLGEWINLRVWVDEKPIFLGGKIISSVEKKEEVLIKDFWRKDVSVVYEQKNPYLNKLDIHYIESKKTVRGKIVKYGIAVGVGVIGGLILHNNFK